MGIDSRFRRGLLSAGLLLIISASARAQGIDVAAEASQSFRPAVALDGSPGTDVGVTAVRVAASVRLALEPQTFLTAGVAYRAQMLDYSGPAPDAADTLHTLELPLMAVHVLDERWSVIGGFTPGLSGDFSGLDRHFRFSAVALGAYAFRRDLVVGFGALLDYGVGRWFGLPVVTVDWQVASGLWLKALGPTVKLTYRLSDRVEAGTFVQIDASRWAVNGGGVPRTIDAFAVDVGALVGLRLAGTTWLNLLGGFTPYRRYDIDGGARAGEYDARPGWMLRGGLEVRFPGS